MYRRSREGFAKMLRNMAWINVALGLAAVLIAFFILQGFRTEVSKKLHSFTGHAKLRPYALLDTPLQGQIHLDKGLYNRYTSGQISELSFVQPYALQPALLKTKKRVIGVQFKGIGSAYPDGLSSLQTGRTVDLSVVGYTRECVLSTKVAAELGLSLGDTLIIHFLKNPPRYRKLKVVGMYKTALEELDARIVLGDLRLLQRLHNWHSTQADALELFFKPNTEQETIIEQLLSQIAYGLHIVSAAEDYPQLFDWLALLDKNTYIFLGLIISVAGFNMLALCIILIMERKNMVQILRIMGASVGWIRQVFFFHGLWWVLWGMCWGNVLAYAFAFVQSRYQLLRLDATNYAMDYVPVHIDIPLWVWINVLFLGWLSFALLLALRGVTRQRALIEKTR